ncbi:unnamed protein product [Rotaria socialis]|uniref:NHL repeat containing protein n=1 Tax=Rotaria socialis TaxID=392032 RepID=A0A820NGW7_9BILA|nr:unnamed protein product [Rotaria socialis]CAF4390626.1 unnamed protein product [Rotaria socialis]
MAQYERCSTNAGCACLHIPGPISVGICSYLSSITVCSQLVKCGNNNRCYAPNHECLYHPKCQSTPICFPVQSFNGALCPLIATTNATTTTATPTTTTTRTPQIVIPTVPANAKWTQNGMTVAGGQGDGSANNQLWGPVGLFVDDDQTVVIADYWNHRIMQWKKGDKTNGQVVAGGKGQGNRLDQLHWPIDVLIDKETDGLIICDQENRRVVRWSRLSGTTQGEILIDNIDCVGLTMDDQRYLYVSDYGKEEIKRYELGDKNGTLVAGENGEGSGLDQLSNPRYLFVDRQQNVYVSDETNHRVMKWNKGAKEGILVAGGQGEGNALTQLNYPQGLFVDTLGTLYVADWGDERIMRWPQGAKQGTVIVGGNGQGLGANQLHGPLWFVFRSIW